MSYIAFNKTDSPVAIARRFQERTGYMPPTIIYPPASRFTAEDWAACKYLGITVSVGPPAKNVALAGPLRGKP